MADRHNTPVDTDQGFQPKQANSIDSARVGMVAFGNDDGYDAHYSGDLDDLRFYTGSATEQDAKQLYELTY